MRQLAQVRPRFTTRGIPALTLLMAAVLAAPVPSHAVGWKAGVATAVITPEEPVWMAGYSNRTEPSQGTIHDLFVKSLAIEDSLGGRAVIVTADIIGYTYEFTDAVSKEIGRRFGLPRSALFFNASHTHCGPELRPSKTDFLEIPAEYKKKIERYDGWLRERYIRVISDALASMKPAELSYSSAAPVPISSRFFAMSSSRSAFATACSPTARLSFAPTRSQYDLTTWATVFITARRSCASDMSRAFLAMRVRAVLTETPRSLSNGWLSVNVSPPLYWACNLVKVVLSLSSSKLALYMVPV